jgi:hypothetical protein
MTASHPRRGLARQLDAAGVEATRCFSRATRCNELHPAARPLGGCFERTRSGDPRARNSRRCCPRHEARRGRAQRCNRVSPSTSRSAPASSERAEVQICAESNIAPRSSSAPSRTSRSKSRSAPASRIAPTSRSTPSRTRTSWSSLGPIERWRRRPDQRRDRVIASRPACALLCTAGLASPTATDSHRAASSYARASISIQPSMALASPRRGDAP